MKDILLTEKDKCCEFDFFTKVSNFATFKNIFVTFGPVGHLFDVTIIEVLFDFQNFQKYCNEFLTFSYEIYFSSKFLSSYYRDNEFELGAFVTLRYLKIFLSLIHIIGHFYRKFGKMFNLYWISYLTGAKLENISKKLPLWFISHCEKNMKFIVMDVPFYPYL